MKIYVASSWRNPDQPDVVHLLRLHNHQVYDFRHPKDGDTGFHWSQIAGDWKAWTARASREALNHPIAQNAFNSDMTALQWCDAVVAVQPFGVSAALELGWATGMGKLTILYLFNGEPELMVKMVNHICVSMDAILKVLDRKEDEAQDRREGLASRTVETEE